MSTDGYEEFVKVEDVENNETVELPLESDETLLLTTLQGQFPNAVGLRYPSSSGDWRGVRISGEALNPPHGGWGSDTVYQVTINKSLKRKNEGRGEVSPKSSRHDSKLQDLIVLGLPMECKETDLKEYFSTACGELALYQVKYNRETNKSKGFGFIRFDTEEGTNAALTGEHVIMGKPVQIKLSTKKREPMKLFVGRIPAETSVEELKEIFEEFGEITDVYIPKPGSRFAFVTFQHSIDARAALRRTHRLGGERLTVECAEPLEAKKARLRREEEEKSMKETDRRPSYGSYGGDQRDSRNRESRDMRDNMRYNNVNNGDGNHSNKALYDTVTQLKGLLDTVLAGR